MLPHDPRTHQHLAEQVEKFLAKRGLDQPNNPSTLVDKRFQTLKHWDTSHRLECVAQLVYQHETTQSYLDIESQLHRRRTIYEGLMTNLDPESDIMKLVISFNGRNSFKCPKFFCDRFYDGFVDERRRKEHLHQHDRPFRCTVEGCLSSKLGYGTYRDLKRHLKSSHPTDEDLHWTFPLANRPKKRDIFSAVEAGDLDTVRRSVEEFGISANSGKLRSIYNGGVTPLCLAALHNRVEVVKYLLGKGVDVNLRLKGNTIHRPDTALGIAVRLDHTAVAELLFENGASLEFTNAKEARLNEAVGARNLSMVKLLLQKGAGNFILMSDKVTPIQIAMKNGSADMLRLLVNTDLLRWFSSNEVQDVLNYTDSNGYEDISSIICEMWSHFAPSPHVWFQVLSKADRKVTRRMLDVLSLRGMLEAKGDSGNTVLHWAGAEGNVTMTRALLEYGVGVDETNDFGETTLHLACQDGPIPNLTSQKDHPLQLKRDCYAVVRLLLKNCASAKTPNLSGQTPLHTVGLNGNVAIMKALLEHGVTVDEMDDNGETPLHLACRGDHIDRFGQQRRLSATDRCAVVKLLLEKGASAKTGNWSRLTPLHLEAANGDVIIMRTLLEHGLAIDETNTYGETALHRACQGRSEGCYAIVELLLEKGANADARTLTRITPLHVAAISRSQRTVQLLLSHGVDVHVSSSHGLTALDYALQDGQHALADMLRDHGATTSTSTIFSPGDFSGETQF